MGGRSQQAQGEMGAARVCKEEPTLTPRAGLLLELRDSFVLASSPPSLLPSPLFPDTVLGAGDARKPPL